ncbi:AI-2E family transporter [Rhizobium leguminosarum]|uniref:AI-2E family transporter n=1 Tax=Rhizobium leguminosarum TaxID=384 RepID=UPI0021BBCFA7|nr:AI-2E family transporter [Rhizobium leguminosarum]
MDHLRHGERTPENEAKAMSAFGTVLPRWTAIGLFIYASILFLSFAREFLVPIVLSFLLALVFSPIRRFLDERGVPSVATSLIIIGALIAALAIILGAIIVPVSGYVESLPRIEQAIQEKLAGMSQALSGLFEASRRLTDFLRSHAANVQQVELRGNGLITSAALFVPALIAQTLFTLVLLLFLLASGDILHERLVEILPTVQDKNRAVEISHDIERKLSRYLLTITTINVCLGGVVAALLWLSGMPNPLLFGVLAFICNFVPYLGPLVSMTAACAVALISSSGVGFAVAIASLYLLVMTIEGQIITPYFIGRRLRLNTVVVFVAISFWAWLWSIVGMLVAVPLLVTVSVFCEHVESLRGLGNLLSARNDR